MIKIKTGAICRPKICRRKKSIVLPLSFSIMRCRMLVVWVYLCNCSWKWNRWTRLSIQMKSNVSKNWKTPAAETTPETRNIPKNKWKKNMMPTCQRLCKICVNSVWTKNMPFYFIRTCQWWQQCPKLTGYLWWTHWNYWPKVTGQPWHTQTWTKDNVTRPQKMAV